MPDFAHRTMPMTYSIPADGGAISCRWTTESGEEMETNNVSLDYDSVVEFAVFLLTADDWKFTGGGFSCSIKPKSEKVIAARGPFEWCHVSGVDGKLSPSKLPRGFFTRAAGQANDPQLVAEDE